MTTTHARGAAPPQQSIELSKARGEKLVLAHIYTSTLVLGLGALFGMLQGFSRANWIVMPDWFDYYRMLTAHGVLMALVFTTFFITGFLTYATYTSIPRVRSTRLNWIGYYVMLLGTVMATIAILDGSASVLYTFYAPLKASPLFYFGATFLIAGTWFVAYDVMANCCGSRSRIRSLRCRCRRSWLRRRWSCGSSRRWASSPRCSSSFRGRWE